MRRTELERFWAKVRPEVVGCWLWTASVRKKGYGVFTLANTGDGPSKHVAAHRYSYELAYGPIPDGMFVCHSCDVPLCVRPDHLFLGTNADNMKDCHAKGRHTRGERTPWSKLTEGDVLDIRRRHDPGVVTMTDLAREFSVSVQTVWDIVYRRNWKHV